MNYIYKPNESGSDISSGRLAKNNDFNLIFNLNKMITFTRHFNNTQSEKEINNVFGDPIMKHPCICLDIDVGL